MEFFSCIKNLPRHFKSAFQNIRRNFVMSMSSIFTILVTLLLIGGIALVALNIEAMASGVEESLTIYVKVDHDLTDEQAQELKPTLLNVEGVESLEFSSKDQELDKLIASQNEAGQKLFETYRDNNPLGCAYTVTASTDVDIKTVANAIENIDAISEVNYGGETTTSLIQMLKRIRNICSILVAVLCLFAIFLIANTIKMAIEARNEEIKIMRLVGASNWYIRLPYMLEGLLIGFFGSIVPIIAVILGYPFVYKSMVSYLPTMVALIAPYPFVWYLSLGVLLSGMIVTAIGSIFAVARYLKH